MYKNLNLLKNSQIFREKLITHKSRSYHSKNGVYGYQNRTQNNFKISGEVLISRNNQSKFFRWIEAYRKYGHKLASVNPVNFVENIKQLEELCPEYYGLKSDECLTSSCGILNLTSSGLGASVCEVEETLRKIYCGDISAEFSYVESINETEWLIENYEQIVNHHKVSCAQCRDIAALLIKSQVWDHFLATKFPTVKRYGGEGAESFLAFFHQIFQLAAKDDLQHIVLGMPHRGRGNLQTTMLNLSPAKVFRKLQGGSEFSDDLHVMGDVLSHFHSSEELDINGKKIRISLLRNPSHLEAVNPVSMGKTRSKQQSACDGAFNDDPCTPFSSSILNIQLHGDAAFPGQGINQECLAMAYVPHFEVGGTIHMIINNQVGFTTPSDRAHSTSYCTDLAKMIQAPVFHVNGDDPEKVALVSKLAFNYQRKFRKDVFMDLNCFRRWGHNELDDPTFTNPALYGIINNRKSVPDLYVEKLTETGLLTAKDADKIKTEFMDYLNKELTAASTYTPEPSYFERQWKGFTLATDDTTFWDTGLDYSLLSYIGNQSVSYPKEFNIHPHLQKTYVEGRLRKLREGQKIDWATAEALAIGSLMYQGHNVRLSGEDVGRGTFSHRHAMLVDQNTNEMYIPMNSIDGGLGGKLELASSILSEEAVLGYEYGMAIDNPNNLIIWEAQFGDFANGAQIIIDNFIFSGETKWMQSNGLVMLLPHGYDGAASEHSSCRLERFLQQTDSSESSPDGDSVNVHIVNPTTPAQYYHVLRRQMLRNFRKPLVVVGPKTLIRLSSATSSYKDFEPGTFFKNVLGDEKADPKKVTKIILCSGKHFYDLDSERTKKQLENIAILRLESLCPFPIHDIQKELEKYPNVQDFVWSQEEARNMGAWSFVHPRFEYLIGRKLKYSGRAEVATAATGDGKVHRKEVEEIMTKPFNL